MYGIDHYHVIVTIATQVLLHYINIQLFEVHMRLHTWIKPNRTVPVQTNDNIITTRRLLSRIYSIPAQFIVNTNYNGYNRHCTTMYNANRNVCFNPISHSTCTTSKPWYL